MRASISSGLPACRSDERLFPYENVAAPQVARARIVVPDAARQVQRERQSVRRPSSRHRPRASRRPRSTAGGTPGVVMAVELVRRPVERGHRTELRDIVHRHPDLHELPSEPTPAAHARHAGRLGREQASDFRPIDVRRRPDIQVQTAQVDQSRHRRVQVDRGAAVDRQVDLFVVLVLLDEPARRRMPKRRASRAAQPLTPRLAEESPPDSP